MIWQRRVWTNEGCREVSTSRDMSCTYSRAIKHANDISCLNSVLDRPASDFME
jgi:hypothetical protein